MEKRNFLKKLFMSLLVINNSFYDDLLDWLIDYSKSNVLEVILNEHLIIYIVINNHLIYVCLIISLT